MSCHLTGAALRVLDILNVLPQVKRGFPLDEIAAVPHIGQRLVEAYVPIAKERHPTAFNNPHQHRQATVSSLPATCGAT